MKQRSRIILVFIVATIYFIPNFYRMGDEWDSIFSPKSSSEKRLMFTLSESNLSDCSINLTTANKILNGKIVKIKINSTEPGKNSLILKQVKSYQQNNDIHFNFPLISFNFSLRDYTEGSWAVLPFSLLTQIFKDAVLKY